MQPALLGLITSIYDDDGMIFDTCTRFWFVYVCACGLYLYDKIEIVKLGVVELKNLMCINLILNTNKCRAVGAVCYHRPYMLDSYIIRIFAMGNCC